MRGEATQGSPLSAQGASRVSSGPGVGAPVAVAGHVREAAGEVHLEALVHGEPLRPLACQTERRPLA